MVTTVSKYSKAQTKVIKTSLLYKGKVSNLEVFITFFYFLGENKIFFRNNISVGIIN